MLRYFCIKLLFKLILINIIVLINFDNKLLLVISKELSFSH